MGDNSTNSKKKKIMIVEDDSAERDLYEEMLKDEYDVTKAKDGETALEKLSPDLELVILDRKMPGLTGGQVLKKIRGSDDPEIKNMAAIMLTALDADLDIINMEFDDYLNKLVSPEELRQKIKDTLAVSEYSKKLNEYYSLINKKNVLQESLSEEELSNNEKYQELEKELEDYKEKINEEITEIMEKIPLDKTDEFQKLLKNVIDT